MYVKKNLPLLGFLLASGQIFEPTVPWQELRPTPVVLVNTCNSRKVRVTLTLTVCCRSAIV